MNRLTIWIILYLYYIIWLCLPLFDYENKLFFFPLPSKYAIFIPVYLLLIGFILCGGYMSFVILRDSNIDPNSYRFKRYPEKKRLIKIH